ncbi:MAG TPA: hypothetical protein VF306_18080 [Pirellulales bacterium]
MCVYLVAAALIVGLLPAQMRSRVVGFYLAMAGSGMLLHLLTVFSYGVDVELSKKDSGYPQRTFTLPVSTWKLVSCPMLGGLAAIYAVWIWAALFVLRPCGHPSRLLSPAAVLAAFLAVIQALAWTPFAEGWMRIVLTTVILTLLAASHFVLVHVAGIASEGWNVAAFGMVWGVAWWAALSGVSRARRGDAFNWPAAQRLIQRIMERQPGRRRAFRSASHAQRWYELRRGAALAPFYVGVLLAMLTPVLFLERSPGASKWGLAMVAVFLPPLIFGCFGATLGKPDPWSRSAISGFLATRPLSCADLVAAKFRAAITASALSCLMIIVFLLLWLTFARNREMVLRSFQDFGPVKSTAIGLLGPILWWAFIWKSLAEGFYLGLTGREWVVNAAGIFFGSLFMLMLGGGLLLYFHPDYVPEFLRWTTWLLGAALAAKLGLAAWAMYALCQRRLVPRPQILQCLAVWCAIVAIVCCGAVWLVPWEWASPWALSAGCILMAPFSRLAAAPLALAWNRHR